MKKLILMLPVLAGCATAPVSSVRQDDAALRAEVAELRKEVESLKARSSLNQFVRGRRVKKSDDLRKDLPKGVAR